MASTILVTGASGFVGRHLLPALRDAFPAGRLVAAAHRRPVPDADETHPLDLLDRGALAAHLAKLRPDAILHLAAQAAVPRSFAEPEETWRINLMGTLALAGASMQGAPGCLFVFASSSEVYGLAFRRGVPLDEDAPMAPANPYAASKAAADLALGEMALRGLHVLRLRAFNQAGPGQSEDYVVSAFARQVALAEAGLQEPVLRVGTLDRWRDFLDVRDACAAYVAAVARGQDLTPGTALNIASGMPRRVGDVLEGFLARSDLPMRVEQAPARLRPTDVEAAAGDATRAREALGWAPRIPWEQTLDDVLRDWRRRVREQTTTPGPDAVRPAPEAQRAHRRPHQGG
jgi:GDP-4-dehydro-6-deoxy-D-mannose reductase